MKKDIQCLCQVFNEIVCTYVGANCKIIGDLHITEMKRRLSIECIDSNK